MRDRPYLSFSCLAQAVVWRKRSAIARCTLRSGVGSSGIRLSSGLRRLRIPVFNLLRSLLLDDLPPHHKVQRERHLIGMGCTPGNDSRELCSIALDATYLHQFGLDDLRVPHIHSACHRFVSLKTERKEAGLVSLTQEIGPVRREKGRAQPKRCRPRSRKFRIECT
jgi:hypothetical protein